MKKMSFIEKIKRAIKNKITYKERFLRACAYDFYIQKTKIKLGGVNFLPFVDAQDRHNQAKAIANEFVEYCKRNNIVNERFKLALQYARTGK